ncbi:hypothetical protein NQ315_012107 [Exocentrus adspersus]|uniref:Alpha-carbonic anhydrase domain-containing protein n=1 Tax=Exocentrus adspersus TaxID=1586481 RepID=A0AAV8VYL9_9CUCU|nr:hypothetical protein NQ315_012107 [Exocentrus adspersus]
MDWLSSFTEDSDTHSLYFIIIAILILGALYLYDTYVNNNTTCLAYDNNLSNYGYGDCGGPATWPQKYLSAGGQLQSPINLIARGCICVPSETVDPLSFSHECHVPPCDMKLYNNGHNVVVYVTPTDNPYMEPIVSALRYIKYPGGCVSIEPIILSLLTPDFSRDYFTYTGSLTFPPCTECVKWIVKPEPLLISSKQVRKFRKLYGCTGPIIINTRPVQKSNNRDIFYYD